MKYSVSMVNLETKERKTEEVEAPHATAAHDEAKRRYPEPEWRTGNIRAADDPPSHVTLIEPEDA